MCNTYLDDNVVQRTCACTFIRSTTLNKIMCSCKIHYFDWAIVEIVSLGGGNVWKLCVEKLWRMECLRHAQLPYYICYVKHQEWRPALLVL